MFRKYLKILLKLLIFLEVSTFATVNLASIKNQTNATNNQKLESSSKEESIPNISQNDQYLLGAGDSLSLIVVGASELNANIKILNDGNALVPLLGAVKLDGLSINGATKYLEDLFSKELINPKVELFLLSIRPLKISIIGEVSRPGIYKLNSNTNDLPTVITILEEAGGLSKYADLTSIKLKRRLPGEDLIYKETTLNLKNLILNGDFYQNPYLFDGDIIKISRVKDLDQQILSISTTTLSPKNINVNFLGEVNNPGSLKIKANTTLIDGILRAGGPRNWRSNYGFVEILRINRDGSAFRKKYRINLSQSYSEQNNPVLNDGDTVWIRRNNLAKATDTLGNIASPLKDIVSIWTLFKLLD